jgi:prophage regulatory protein
MNKLEYELLNTHLEQLPLKTQNTVRELQLLQRHIDQFKSQIIKRDISEQTRSRIPELALTTVQASKNRKQPNDLIRIKEVMQMTSLSKSSIYVQRNNGDFPRPIQLSSRSVAWVRSDVEAWVLDKINNTYL